MVQFIIAGILYLVLMFLVLFVFSFVTIGLVYLAAALARRCTHWVRQPTLVLK